MPTNLHIGDRLLDEARETANEALAEYTQRRRRRELVKYFGKVDVKPGWGYKKARRAR